MLESDCSQVAKRPKLDTERIPIEASSHANNTSSAAPANSLAEMEQEDQVRKWTSKDWEFEGVNLLGEAVLRLEDTFVTGGQLNLLENVVLRLKNSKNEETEVSLPFKPYRKQGDSFVPTAELSTLLNASVASPFGHGKATKLDSSVRSARHIPADAIIAIEGFSVESIVDTAKGILFPMEDDVRCQVRKGAPPISTRLCNIYPHIIMPNCIF